MIKMEEEQVDLLKAQPLSDTELQGILQTPTNVFTYPDLDNYRHIDEIFDPLGRAIMLYLTENDTTGHYISLIKRGNVIEVYNPYGASMKEMGSDLGLSANEDQELNGGYGKLHRLAQEGGYTLKENKSKVQKDGMDVATCGRHTGLRTLLYKMSMEDYNKWLNSGKGNGIDADDLVVALTA